MPESSQVTEISSRKPRTLKKPAFYSGIGIHTGQEVSMRFVPAKEGTGIVFKRTDLPGNPIVPAAIEYVCDTNRSTTIGVADVRIHTVEHVLAAVYSAGIDNLCIEISSIEPPIGNGSSDVFVAMIEEAEVEEQAGRIPILSLARPVWLSEGDIHLVAHPCESCKVSYTLSYPNSQVLKAQFHSMDLTWESFKKEIASCRTFSEYREIEALMDRGLIKGGSLDNAVIINDDVVFSKDGLYFPDEMVRHKMLDLIGDLSLIGVDFRAHVMAIRSGHQTNFAFAKKLYHTLTQESPL